MPPIYLPPLFAALLGISFLPDSTLLLSKWTKSKKVISQYKLSHWKLQSAWWLCYFLLLWWIHKILHFWKCIWCSLCSLPVSASAGPEGHSYSTKTVQDTATLCPDSDLCPESPPGHSRSLTHRWNFTVMTFKCLSLILDGESCFQICRGLNGVP